MTTQKPKRKMLANGRSAGGGRFVSLPEWLLASAAYRALSPYARCLLVEMKRLYNGSNNGDLFLGQVAAAERMGVAKKTAQKAFADLKSGGFIRPVVSGSFSWKNGQATRWVLTEYDHDGRPATKDFMRSGADQAAARQQKRDTREPGSGSAKIQNPGLPRSPHRATTCHTQATTYPGHGDDRDTREPGLPEIDPKTGLPRSQHLICHGEGAER